MQAFASNGEVSFGDINLSDEQIRANHNPGQGGWPTIRYFNKETGIEGAAYVKKTDDAMCTELGNDKYMTEYITEAGKTSLCSAETTQGCGEREIDYITKMKAKSGEEIQSQFKRLNAMSGESMKPELEDWKNKRLAILKQLAPGPVAKDQL